MPHSNYNTDSSYKRQLSIGLIGVFLLIVTIFGLTMVSQVQKHGRQTTGNALTARLKTNQASMDLWFNHISSDIQSWASTQHFQVLVEKHLTHSRDQQSLLASKTLQDLRVFFAPRLQQHNFNGFFIIAPDLINIGSMRDANIGILSLIAAQQPDLLKRCFNGETLFIPPVYSDVPLPDKTGKMIPVKPTMFFATPIKNNQGEVTAVLTIRIIPENNFAMVARIGKLGKTGETYFFDQTGRMLTPSRFEKQLKTIGLIQEGQTSVLNLEIRDPGGELLAGHIPALARADQPLTHMAKMAIEKTSGIDINGYRDYRGVQVIGSWLWNDTLEIGMATEINLSEATQTSDKIRLLFIIINSVTIAFGFIIFFIIFKKEAQAGQKSEQILIESKEKLELRVRERTLDLQKINKKLRLAKSAAEKSNQAKSVFLASMSHELRTPLNSILGYTQLMETKIDKDEHPHKEYLSRVLKSGEHLLRLIDEILDLAKIESDSIELSIEPIDVRSLVLEAIEFVRPMAVSHGIEILPEEAKEPIVINADRIRFNQMLLNLLTNAIKYNRPSGKVRIFCEPSGSRLRLNIADTGIGIEKNKIGLLFDPFNRLGAETSSIEGTGIGLTITKRLVEMMEGRIGVESEPGTGTTFFVEFALAPDPIKKQKITAQTSTSYDFDLTGEHTILYVEDNKINQALIEVILKEYSDITLLKADNGTQGIEMAVNHKPDLILMDIGLPDMNGFEAFERISKIKETKHIPVVGLSANAMPHDVKKAMDAGFTEYLTKPINIGKFIRVAAAALNSQRE